MIRRSLSAGLFNAALTATAMAGTISLQVDSAPNVFGSPDWAGWWSSTKSDVVAGGFVDMRTGTFPGTHTADPYDFIVYSTMDLGKRTHWIYWLPDETTAALDGRFEVKWVVDWDGVSYTYDWNTNQLVANNANVGWIQPGSWEDYNDGTHSGVIGSFGFAWWATDNEAAPFDTGGSPYDETDQADIDSLRSDVLASQTFLTGKVRTRETLGDPWQTQTLRVDVIPEPATLVLLVFSAGLLGFRRR